MFSYFSYLEYLLKVTKKKNVFNANFKNLQDNVVEICSLSKEKFWRNLYLKNITFKEYKRNCLKIKKNVVFNEPVQYITKKCYFYGFQFWVSKGVFSPQPDTEILIRAFNFISRKIWNSNFRMRLLEIGTGTGAISISLSLLNQKNWFFVCTDINKKAISVAKRNSYQMGVKNIRFVNCNLFPNLLYKFDVLISNPPYVSIDRYWNASPLVKKQPKNSLLSSEKGIYFYRKIITRISCFLKEKFLVLFEIDNFIFKEVERMIVSFFPSAKIEHFKDFSNNLRVIACYSF